MTEQTHSTTLHDLRVHFQDRRLYQQALDYALDYLHTVDERPVFPTDEALAALSGFDEALPDAPYDPFAMLRLLHEVGSPATTAQGGGRYFGFVNGGILPGALAARILADVWDQNGGMYIMSPIAATLEQRSEQWLVDLFGLPEDTAMGIVTGTSTATLCGMLVGRNVLLANQGWDVARQGLFGAPPIRVILSTGAHSSVKKALTIIGIGSDQIEWVAADEQGRLQADQLPELDANTLVLLQAGNVNTGAFDPFSEVCARARAAGAWVHIDGAFGLWAAGSERTKHLTAGIEQADSWSVDGHKTLNAPYDSGLIFCRDRAAMAQAMQASGDYLVFSAERDNMLYTPDMSRRARGVELWALLKTLGRSGIDALVSQLCERATLFGTLLHESGFRVLNDIVFNQVLVACDTPQETEATLKAVQQSGELWCGGSRWNDEPAIRISVCSWVTTEDDVRRSVRAFVTARQHIG